MSYREWRFFVTSEVIRQWFSRVTKSRVKIIGKSRHEWPKSLLAVTNALFYFLHAIWCSEHTIPLKSSSIAHFAIVVKDDLFWLSIVTSSQLICDVTGTRGSGIVTSYSSIVLVRTNWRKGDLHWRNWYIVFGHGCDTTDCQMSLQPRRTPQTPKCHHNRGAAEVAVAFGSLWCHSHDRKRGINFYSIMVPQNWIWLRRCCQTILPLGCPSLKTRAIVNIGSHDLIVLQHLATIVTWQQSLCE